MLKDQLGQITAKQEKRILKSIRRNARFDLSKARINLKTQMPNLPNILTYDKNLRKELSEKNRYNLRKSLDRVMPFEEL